MISLLGAAAGLGVVAWSGPDAVRLDAGIAAAAGQGARAAPAFEVHTKRITGYVRKRITGSSWHRGCPVPRSKLRLIRASHWNFKGEVRRGALIVHRNRMRPMVRTLRGLYRARFPIRRMKLIDRYGADDRRSMEADNTSAFNCRFVAGTSRWSEHAYGRAIDVNPVENPYVTPSGHVSPPAGRAYVDRSRRAKGMIHRNTPAFRAFKRSGWKWGGNWSGTKDYHHFSSTGN